MNSCELAWKIRRHSIEMAHIAHASHVASALSIADITAVLYSEVMQVFPDNPSCDQRDRFILSKGHASAAVYAALAEMGFFSVDELKTFYGNASRLSGHISHMNVPGVEVSTGSLGHGGGIGCGMALAAKMDDKPHRVFVLMGDGECQEGSVWEMAAFANHYKLDNMFVIIDHNKFQSLDTCENTLSWTDLNLKWRAFNWRVLEVDGHDHHQLREALQPNYSGAPTCVIAHTTKGKGVSFMENSVLWHYRDPQGELYSKSINELENNMP